MRTTDDKLYSEMETLIIAWNIDGTKTAGTLTRQIMKLLDNDNMPLQDYEWVCNECNFSNFTSSVSEDEIESESHACINCGCFEFHKNVFVERK